MGGGLNAALLLQSLFTSRKNTVKTMILLKNKLLYIVFPLLFVWSAQGSGTCGSDGFPLVEDGIARAVVVVPDDPYPVAVYAAEELISHIKKSTGTGLSMVEESKMPESPEFKIFIGNTSHAELAGINTRSLKPESFEIRREGNQLFIAGEDGPGDPLNANHAHSGTLFGVYDFLDQEMGVRWLWPGELGTYIPKHGSLEVKPEQRVADLHFQWQTVRHGIVQNDPRIGFTEEGLETYRDAQNVFLRRHRMNHSRSPSVGHAFGGWWETYGEEHPEWFYQHEDGTRGPLPGAPEFQIRHTPMCVSNPELHDKVLEVWEQQLETYRETPVLRLAEADGRGVCMCDECIAWDAPQPWEEKLEETPQEATEPGRPHIFETLTNTWGHAWDTTTYNRFVSMTDLDVVSPGIVGSHYPRDASDRYLRFWKTLHDRAAKIAPDVKTTAYVYQNYFLPPSEPVSLSPNIHFHFVPWGGFWFPRRLDEHQWVKDQWLAWQETGASMTYRPNYFHDGYVMPHVFARQFADKFKFIAENGAVGTSFDSLKGQWGTQGTTLYLLMRLHTRPGESVEDLLLEYYEAFGPAATHVKAYYEYWEAYSYNNQFRWDEIAADEGRVVISSDRWNEYSRFAHHLFPSESFETAQAILDRAATVVPEDPDNEYTRRVQFLQKGLDHARKTAALAALFDDEEVPAEEREQAYRELVEFRHGTESWFISNLTHAVRQESQSWVDRPGYIGE